MQENEHGLDVDKVRETDCVINAHVNITNTRKTSLWVQHLGVIGGCTQTNWNFNENLNTLCWFCVPHVNGYNLYELANRQLTFDVWVQWMGRSKVRKSQSKSIDWSMCKCRMMKVWIDEEARSGCSLNMWEEKGENGELKSFIINQGWKRDFQIRKMTIA